MFFFKQSKQFNNITSFKTQIDQTPISSDIQESSIGMQLHIDHNITFIPCNNTNVVYNNNDLSHSTSVVPTGISFAQLSADGSVEHAQNMPTISCS